MAHYNSSMAAAYYKEFQAQPVISVGNPYEALPKLFNYELHQMQRGFAMSLFGAPGGKTGEAKCVKGTTIVSMPSGSRKIKDLRVGDVVVGINARGRPEHARVLALHRSRRLVLKVVTKEGRVLECSPEHRVLTKRGWVEAQSLKSKDSILLFHESYLEYRAGRSSSESDQGWDDTEGSFGKDRSPAIAHLPQSVHASQENGRGSKLFFNSVGEEEYLEAGTDSSGTCLLGGNIGRGGYGDVHSVFCVQGSKQGSHSTPYSFREHERSAHDMDGNTFGGEQEANDARLTYKSQNAFSIDFSRNGENHFILGEGSSVSNHQESASGNTFEVLRGKESTEDGRYLHRLASRALLENEKSQLHGDSIESVHRTDEVEELYDITTSLGNYIANGIVVHNSYTAMSLGQMMAPKHFGIDDICFSITEFLDRLDYYEDRKYRYRTLVMDESETAIPSSAWFSVFNRAIADTVATFRYMRCTAIFVTPLWSWIDKRVRSMVRYGGAPTLTLNDQTGKREARLKFSHISTDLEGDKVYMPKLNFYDKTLHQHVVVEYFKVEMPTPDLVEAYESKAADFKKKHRRDLKEDVKLIESITENKREVFDPALLYDDLIKNQMVSATIQKKGNVNVPLIENVYRKMSHRNARRLAAYTNNRLLAENPEQE